MSTRAWCRDRCLSYRRCQRTGNRSASSKTPLSILVLSLSICFEGLTSLFGLEMISAGISQPLINIDGRLILLTGFRTALRYWDRPPRFPRFRRVPYRGRNPPFQLTHLRLCLQYPREVMKLDIVPELAKRSLSTLPG